MLCAFFLDCVQILIKGARSGHTSDLSRVDSRKMLGILVCKGFSARLEILLMQMDLQGDLVVWI